MFGQLLGPPVLSSWSVWSFVFPLVTCLPLSPFLLLARLVFIDAETKAFSFFSVSLDETILSFSGGHVSQARNIIT